MTCQELITASTENIPVKVVVFNNGNHGMVRQWQKIFYNSKFSASELTHDTPDYVKLAESMGAVGLRMTKKDDVKKVFSEMLKTNDKPVLIECVVDPDDMVFPMVPAGGSNDQIIMNKEDLKQL
jgi:acetolactate synthase-1/2/3 large subunit